MSITPERCDHLRTRRVSEARIVYGTPGTIPARYECLDCKVFWDDPTERPDVGGAIYTSNDEVKDAITDVVKRVSDKFAIDSMEKKTNWNVSQADLDIQDRNTP